MGRLTIDEVRRAWARAQRLGGDGAADEVPGGWARALGGVDPYLALAMRVPGFRREMLDSALEDGRVAVVPGVRGCIWLVPRADLGLCLRVSAASARKRLVRELGQAGVDEAELQRIGEAAVAVLADGAQSTDALRDALPDGLVRSLGDAGKKKGHSTNFPAALRLLEWDGRIRRVLKGHVVDTATYAWVLATPEEVGLPDAPTDEAAQARALAARFFAWAGVATVDEFLGWAKIGKRVGRAAVAELSLDDVDVDGLGEAKAWPGALDGGDDDGVYLLPSQDNLLSLRGAPGLLADARHQDRELMGIGGRKVTVATAGWMMQRPVVYRGEWIGLWEWDRETKEIVVAGFDDPTSEIVESCRTTCVGLRPVLADDLAGEARANSIDGMKSQVARAAAVRAMLALLFMVGLAGCPKTGEKAATSATTEEPSGVVVEDGDGATKVTIDGGYLYSIPDDLSAEMPWDDGVRTGVLDNGLRWYVEPNKVPRDRVELWLAVRVGSVQEDDDQQGLAHLLEHMAFNGTENFPGNTLITYLESVGTRFGAHLNAHTSWEETVYKLQVPTDDPELLDKGFVVLSDWAGGMLLEDEAIEGERGVVLEEWRRSRGAWGRTWDITLPLLYKDAPHAQRRPIGTEESLKSFTPEAVRRYFADWYRPDLMAVIVVGDLEPDDAQRRIEEAFGGMPAAKADARAREDVIIPQHEETLVGIVADPEQTFSSVRLTHKFPDREENSHQSYRDTLVQRLYQSVMRERLTALARQPDAPLQSGFVGGGRMGPTTSSRTASASSRTGMEKEALEAVLLEVERAARYGVLPSELDRAKKAMVDSYRSMWVDRENQTSRRVLGELVRNFTNGETVPGVGYEYAAASVWIPEIAKAEVDALAKDFLPEDSRVIVVTRPGGELPPLSEEDLLAAVAGVADAELAEPTDIVVPEALVSEAPEPATVVKKTRDEELGTVTWRLSNGAEVVLKTTDFKEDEIMFSGWQFGGHSQYEDADWIPAATASTIASNSGAGEWDRQQIQAYFAGRKGSARTSIGETAVSVSGNAAPKDLEAALQLLWLKVMEPRFTEDGLALAERSQLERVRTRLNDPSSRFWDLWSARLWQDHVRRGAWDEDDIAQMDLERSAAIYEDAFSDIGSGWFVFVGAVDEATLEPLITRWIGTLPDGEQQEWVDIGANPPDGAVADSIRAGIEPKARHRLRLHGAFENTSDNRHRLRTLSSVLSILLREELRENLGGTYSIGARAGEKELPGETWSITVDFQCDPDRLEELRKAAWQILEQVKQAPVAADVTQRVAEQERRGWETSLRSNRYWFGGIGGLLRRGEELSELARYRTLHERITPEYVHDAAQEFLDLDRYVLVTLLPEEAAEAGE